MKKTLFKYIFNMQLKAMLFMSFSVFFLIFLFEFTEITRKLQISSINETILAVKFTFLKVPQTFQEILHYIYFITATFSLWNMCRSHQITILKSVGRSPQQILFPFLSFAFAMAAVWLFIMHPIGIICNIYQESKVNPGYNRRINNDIWIDYRKNNQMIYIKNIKNNEINGLYAFDTKTGDRILASTAKIEGNCLKMSEVVTVKEDIIKCIDKIDIPNFISLDIINLLSVSPKKRSIYSLYKIFSIKKHDNVELKLYELEMHKLLANFFNFILFALIAAIICFPISRYKTKTNIAIKIILSVMTMRFTNSMLESLAYSGVLSVWLASWCVVIILLCLAIATLIWKEV